MKIGIVSKVLIISALLIMFLFLIFMTDIKVDTQSLFIVKDKDKFGIIDMNHKYVLRQEYDFIDRLSEGYARILKEDKWGFINENLDLKIEDKYDYANNFQEGYAAVKIGDKWGFINKNGDNVIEAKYDWASNFNNNIAIVKKDEKFYYIDKNENNIFNRSFANADIFSSGIAIVQSDSNSVEAIDYRGNNLFTLQAKEFKSIDRFNERRLIYCYRSKDNSIKYGFMDTDSKKIGQGYDKLTYFKNGIAFYANTANKKTLWGIIDTNGKIVTNPIYNNVVINSEPIYGASIIDKYGKEKWGYINALGEFIIEPTYDSVGPFDGNYGSVAINQNNELKWGIIDRQNINIVECKYQIIYPFCNF